VSLRNRTFAAGRWTTLSALGVSGFHILQTIALARLLHPADFGLMGVAAAMIGMLSLVADMGLNRALIHFDEIPIQVLSTLYWLNILLAAALSLIIILIAPFLAAMFHSEQLTSVLRWSSLVFPFSAFGLQFRILAEKSLQFSTVAVIEILASAIALAVAVTFALANGNVFALVAALLTRTTTVSVLSWLWLSKNCRPTLHFRPAEAREYVRYGFYLVGDSLANNVNRDSDLFLGGAVLGPSTVGVYAVPRELSLRIATVINPIITRVAFPLMARAKGDRSALKSIYLQVLRMTASINFPVFAALAFFADEIVALLYGPQWRSAVPYLRVLAIWGLIRSVGNPTGFLLYAIGGAKLAFCWNLALVVALPALYWGGASVYGLPGLAIVALVIQLALVVPMWRFLIRPSCGASFLEYLRQLAVPLWMALFAGAASWSVTRGLDHGTVRLAVGGIVGGTTYLGLSAMFNRQWIVAIIELFQPKRLEAH